MENKIKTLEKQKLDELENFELIINLRWENGRI